MVHLENTHPKGNMSRKSTLVKGFFYLSVFSLFVIFYVKDLTIDFAKGRSTMTSRYQKVQTVEFPTLTICMKPGYKNSVFKKYELDSPFNIILTTIPNGSFPILFNEISYIMGRDYDILYSTRGGKLEYTTSPIHTSHHGTCYKLQPLASITKMPEYLFVKIVLKDIKEEDKPRGVDVYLTSNKTWPNIAKERWPQTNPTKFLIEFEDKGLVKGMKLKLTEHIFNEGNLDVANCHRNLFLAKFNCTTKCNFLSHVSLPNCNSTEDQFCSVQGLRANRQEFENCFKVKQFLTYNPAAYDVPENPMLNSSTIKFSLNIEDLQKEVREEVKAITVESLIGSLGGSVGMFFGFSFTATILYISRYINTQCERIKIVNVD